MDNRYMPIIDCVLKRFSDHLGPRLISVYAKGSIARGDAVWGVSDLDLVLAFDTPTAEDTLVKREVEQAVLSIPGGDALVIQRIWDDRLEQMDKKTRVYWLYSSLYEAKVVYGKHPSEFLPAPPKGTEELIISLLIEEGNGIPNFTRIDEKECRGVAKRILQCLSMFLVFQGHAEYIPLLMIPKYRLPTKIQEFLPSVLDFYSNPRVLTDTNGLIKSWQLTCEFINQNRTSFMFE